MHMWANGERRWRKKGKRGVSPIIATILLVAITVVLAAVLYILISGLTKGPGNTPLGTALAVAPPNEGQAGTGYWYNFTVQSASGGLLLNSLAFQVKSSSGAIVTPAGLTTVTVIGLSGSAVGTYTWATAVWATGGTTAVSNQMTIILGSTTSNLSGDTLIILGGGSFSGSISVSIP
ncbi:MAG TPA: archaellin/type IV pilin N-terminal domain-containing protein [Thermoplasmata archaeon]|nr:archaellin/type IV pilin N-terminal domain-containing protein [Thermoplasmata archaeon]HUJ78306.1 archaellin/type IV pilin N-terminal domain-containing protein [Thermoplasmata archaeon]